MQLGGSISLSGFKDLEGSKMIVIKKIVGNYVKKMQEKKNNFEGINIHLKQVHSNQFEIHAKAVFDGNPYNSEVVDFNLFFAVDKVLGKILEELN